MNTDDKVKNVTKHIKLNALDVSADMVLCDVTTNGHKAKSPVLTEKKLEELSLLNAKRSFR